mgnify:CR=1 FL=1
MTEAQFASRLARAAHRGGWRPALLALDARLARLPHWAERIGRHPLIRRSPTTIYHWAQGAAVARSYIADIGKTAVYLLPVSAWIAIAPYAERGVNRDRLLEVLAAFVSEDVSIEQLEATLRETFGEDEDNSTDGRLPVFICGRDPLPAGAAVVCLPGPAEDWEGKYLRVRVAR